MNRRNALKILGSLPLVGFSIGSLVRLSGFGRGLAANGWEVRTALPGDEEGLLALMQSCVASEESFYGSCGPLEWTSTWAAGVVNNLPRSIVITLNETIVAYHDVPSRKPRTFGQEEVDHYQHAFWCGAAGVRMDLLGIDLTIKVFEHLLYQAYTSAMDLGYEVVRAASPWEKHPHLPRPFTEYPGLTSTPFVDESGATKFLLEWRLEDALQALVDEGAQELSL